MLLLVELLPPEPTLVTRSSSWVLDFRKFWFAVKGEFDWIERSFWFWAKMFYPV